MASGDRVQRPDEGMLGIIFDAEAYGHERGARRAWQMWMERLDPSELRGSAFYEGALLFAGNHPVVMLAISAPPRVIAYVRDAFAAPDLAAFSGIAPINVRFVEGADVPRERLTLRGFINQQGKFAAQPDALHLVDIARYADWPYVAPLSPPSAPIERARYNVDPYDIEQEETRAVQATRLEGATQVMLRLWRSSYNPGSRSDRRRRLTFAVVGIVLIASSLGWLAFRLAKASQIPIQVPGVVHATHTSVAVGPLMVVAPLEVRVPCQPGQTAQFTISNNGATSLVWTSDAAQYSPPLVLNNLKGSVSDGDSQVVQVTTSEYVVSQQLITISLMSNGGDARVAFTLGGCVVPTVPPTPTLEATETATPSP